eukprot:8512533-Lingulodinium_polyedra.AAC.1
MVVARADDWSGLPIHRRAAARSSPSVHRLATTNNPPLARWPTMANKYSGMGTPPCGDDALLGVTTGDS